MKIYKFLQFSTFKKAKTCIAFYFKFKFLKKTIFDLPIIDKKN